MTRPLFLPQGVTLLRSARVQRGPMLREDRDGRPTLSGPVRMPPSVATLIAKDIASIFIVPAVILIVVAWAAGEGFGVSVPTQVEETDRVRSYE